MLRAYFTGFEPSPLPHRQCYQMPQVFAQYLDIYNNVKWPKSPLKFPKQLQKFATY